MQKVSSIFLQLPGEFPTKCTFFMPAGDGEAPRQVKINPGDARGIATDVIASLRRRREKAVANYEPFDPEALSFAKQVLMQRIGARPYGRVFVSDYTTSAQATVGGGMHPMLRTVLISPPQKDDFLTLIHELAHLAGMGKVDRLVVLIDPVTMRCHDYQVFDTAWSHSSFAPAYREPSGIWRWDEKSTIIKGLFFEEAMSELVELDAKLRTAPLMDQPIVYKGGELVFEVPVQYGHSVAGWGVTMLETECPGVVRTLLDGARGNTDYAALWQLINGKFAGLFEELYGVSYFEPSDCLAGGTGAILRRLNIRKR